MRTLLQRRCKVSFQGGRSRSARARWPYQGGPSPVPRRQPPGVYERTRDRSACYPRSASRSIPISNARRARSSSQSISSRRSSVSSGSRRTRRSARRARSRRRRTWRSSARGAGPSASRLSRRRRSSSSAKMVHSGDVGSASALPSSARETSLLRPAPRYGEADHAQDEVVAGVQRESTGSKSSRRPPRSGA